MQNFDVQLNLLLVNKPLLVVLTMCLAYYNGANRCPLFSTFCAEFVSNVGKSCQRVGDAFFIQVLPMCEPASHASQGTSHAGQEASHASHGCEPACESHSY